MKMLCVISLLSLSVLTGCKKYQAGCMDPSADNYSTMAKVDDGSCYYAPYSLTESSQVFNTTSANWTFVNPSQRADFTWSVLTQAVADYGNVSFYVLYDFGWVELPYTMNATTAYSSTISAEYGLNSFRISWTDSDLTDPGNPGSLTFKAVAIY